ncbi:outer membrane beta-barrel protein [Sphingobacterium anhuiense]|uniref:Outer membrane beta-barrel protein n=1 Tax=Sphingobacterium anhuiense TaxID=493780 RepID=A0ABW5YXL4_9SPHI
MNRYLLFCFILFQVYFFSYSFAQDFELRGRVLDSLQRGIAGVSVRVYTDNDSLSSGTDKNGNFSFRSLQRGNLSLILSSLGYETYKKKLNYIGEDVIYELPAIVLRIQSQRLQEVAIKVPSPIRISTDTIEFTASAYQVGEHDRLEDLLRQLPGLQIDATGNVTAMGESMYKLRVNGKDFFTNNLKDFLKQLPAGIVAKLQVIDDYGDQANFTGIKVGKTQKMLNLVIKDGQSKGVFGSNEVSASTQGLWSVGLQGNVWLDVHQLSAYANQNNNRTAEGRQRSTNAGTNYRYSSDQINYYGNYGYNALKSTGESETYVESVTSQGTLFNRMQQSNSNDNQGHQIQLNLQSRRKKDFLSLQVSGQKNTGSSENHNISKQTGVIVQDLDHTIQSDSKNNTGNIALSWSRNMSKLGRSLSANLSGSAQGVTAESHIQDQLRFYDQHIGSFLKDSINMRLLQEKKELTNLGFTAKYVEPLNDHATETTKRSIDLGYSLSLRNDQQHRETHVKQEDLLMRIDSLSNNYNSLFNTQQLDMSYRVASPKLQYSLGLSLQPALMRMDERVQHKKVDYPMFSILPIASMRYSPSLKNSIQINYTGTVTAPASDQLMPIRDMRNLQQITVGNPDLKPSKNHGLSVNLAQLEPAKGKTYNLSFNGSLLQDQVTTNILLLPDTLGTLRQEIHYVNVDGSYNLGVNYDMTLPFAKFYQFRWATQMSTNHTVNYLDGIKGANKTLYFSQHLSLSCNKEKLRSTLNFNYYATKSTAGVNSVLQNRIATWEISGHARWTIFPWLIAGGDGSYRINSGYSIPIKNPILVNAFMELYLTKRKELSVQVQVYDLLDQQQAVALMVSSNAVTQRSFNRIGRYALLTVKYNLSRFGGT